MKTLDQQRLKINKQARDSWEHWMSLDRELFLESRGYPISWSRYPWDTLPLEIQVAVMYKAIDRQGNRFAKIDPYLCHEN